MRNVLAMKIQQAKVRSIDIRNLRHTIRRWKRDDERRDVHRPGAVTRYRVKAHRASGRGLNIPN